MKVTYEINVRGRVQGVGFRWFVKRQANLIGITGYVKNLVDGSVLIVAQGEQDSQDAFVSVVKRGSDFAHVKEISTELITSASEYKDFFIAT